MFLKKILKKIRKKFKSKKPKSKKFKSFNPPPNKLKKPTNKLKKIPNELMIKMFLYLSPKNLTQINLVNKIFYKLSNSNPVWGETLKKEKRNKKKNNQYGTENKNTYIKDVQSRELEYIHYDIKGVDYLIKEVFKQRTDLTNIQRAHLGSTLVKRLICTEQLTIKEALYNSSPQRVIGLSKCKLLGIKAGLTREQVEHNWFDYWHAKAAKAEIPYEQYQGLTEDQVGYGILKGLKRKQVIDLDICQLKGMNAGLTREQVKHNWFDYCHAEAAKKGFPYEQYQGLTGNQVEYGILKGLKRKQVIGLNWYQLKGMNAGLTREQVKHKWFGYWHARLAKAKIPYENYKGLSEDEASAIFYRLECKKFFSINIIGSILVMHEEAKYSDSRDSRIAFNTGMVLKEKGNHKRALSCFWRSIEFNPDYFEPAWNLTDIFIQQKNDEEFTRLLNFLGRKGSRALSKLRGVIAKKWPEFSKKYHDEELKNILEYTHSMPVKLLGVM